MQEGGLADQCSAFVLLVQVQVCFAEASARAGLAAGDPAAALSWPWCGAACLRGGCPCRMGSWLSFPLCGEPDTHVPAPMNGLVATVLLQLPFFKHMCGALRSPAACAADRAAMLAFPRRC